MFLGVGQIKMLQASEITWSLFIPLARHHLSRIFFYLLLAIIFSLGFILGNTYNFNLNVKCIKQNQSVPKLLNHDFTYLVVIILSSPDNVDRRQVIRDTWLLTKENHSIKHFFALSVKSLETGRLNELQSEHSIHRDLIFLQSLTDSYLKLSEKVKEIFKWVSGNLKFKFLLKVDDDSFVQLNALHKLLLTLPQEKLYLGFFDGQASVKRRGKWKEENWFLCDKYLPYAKGGGYLLSQDLVHLISSVSEHLVLYKNEDVSVGAWLAPFKVNRVHDPNFDTEYLSRGCFNSYLVTHKQTALMMGEKFKNLMDNKHLCFPEQRDRMSYIYDWNVLPSQCCKRTENVP